MDKIHTMLFIILAWFLSMPTAIAAGSAIDPNNLFEMSLEDLMDITVISASRQEQELTEITVPISIVTDEDIHYSGLTNIPDILRFYAGMDVLTSDRIFTAVGIHGLHDKISDRILTLINGRTADSPLYGGSEFYRYPILTEDIERIEIIRGPGGAAWGANAYQGVINIITKKPEDLHGWFTSNTVSEFGDIFSHLRWADRIDNWNWKVSLGYNDMKDSDSAGAGKMYFANPSLVPYMGDTSKYKARDFSRNFILDTEGNYEISDASLLSLGVGFSHNETGDYEFMGNYYMKNGWFETVRAFTKIDHTFDDGSSGYVQWTGNFNDTYRPSVGKWKAAENDFEVQYNFNLWDRHTASVGGNFRWTHITPEDLGLPCVIYNESHYNEYLAGIFLIDRWTISEKWALEGQIREDWYSPTGEELSTRVTALHTMDKELDQVLRFSIARAYRAPRVNLREGSGSGASLGFSNLYALNALKADGLMNEQMWAFETGYQQKINPKTTLRTDAYYHLINDLIGFYSGISDPLLLGRTFYQARNNGDATAFGVDVEIEYQQQNHSVSVWYSFNDLQTKHDESTANIRSYGPDKNKTGLTWRIFLDDNWVFNTNYQYQDLTPSYGPSEDAKLHHRLDLTLSRRFANDNGEFMVGVTNVTNETVPPAYMIGQFSAYETPGRTFFTRLQWKF